MAMKTPSVFELALGAGLDVAQAQMRDRGRLRAAADLVDLGVPDHLDLGMLEQAVLHDASRRASCRGDGPA